MKATINRGRKKGEVATCVKGLRADGAFWEMVDGVANENGMTRNALILKAVKEYCNGKKGGGRSGS